MWVVFMFAIDRIPLWHCSCELWSFVSCSLLRWIYRVYIWPTQRRACVSHWWSKRDPELQKAPRVVVLRQEEGNLTFRQTTGCLIFPLNITGFPPQWVIVLSVSSTTTTVTWLLEHLSACTSPVWTTEGDHKKMKWKQERNKMTEQFIEKFS